MVQRIRGLYKVDLKILAYVLLSVPFIEPQLFKVSGFEQFDRLFLFMKLAASCVIFIDYIFQFNLKCSKYVIFMMLSQVATFIGTIINQGSITRFMGSALISVSMLMLVELASRINLNSDLVGIEFYLEILVGLHYLTFIPRVLKISPFSNITNTILGIENRWIYVLLPLTILSFLNSYNKHKKISLHAYCVAVLSFFSIIYVWSAGEMLPIC